MAGGGRLATRELPGVAAIASLIYQGGYEGLARPYAAIGRWIEANGHRIAGPGREIYLRAPGNGGEPVTEIQFPVEKA